MTDRGIREFALPQPAGSFPAPWDPRSQSLWARLERGAACCTSTWQTLGEHAKTHGELLMKSRGNSTGFGKEMRNVFQRKLKKKKKPSMGGEIAARSSSPRAEGQPLVHEQPPDSLQPHGQHLRTHLGPSPSRPCSDPQLPWR